MPKDASKLTCEQFQRQISESLALGADIQDLEDHAHARACVVCHQLLRELAVIAEEARKRFPPE